MMDFEPAFEGGLKTGDLVHVDGFNKGAVYAYLLTVNGLHFLRTPMTGRLIQTRRALYYTRKRSHLHITLSVEDFL